MSFRQHTSLDITPAHDPAASPFCSAIQAAFQGGPFLHLLDVGGVPMLWPTALPFKIQPSADSDLAKTLSNRTIRRFRTDRG